MIFTGEDSLIVPLDPARIARFADAVRGRIDWQDVVPGLADCALRFDPERVAASDALAAAKAALASLNAAPDADQPARAVHRLDAVVDGPDAAMVAALLGLPDADALKRWLTARCYRVALVGFQPGFAYLDDVEPHGLPDIARLETPRQHVRAGSIGFLGGRACVYSQDGPGGWPIIGHVRARLFDPMADPPALLTTGDSVRFR